MVFMYSKVTLRSSFYGFLVFVRRRHLIRYIIVRLYRNVRVYTTKVLFAIYYTATTTLVASLCTVCNTVRVSPSLCVDTR